MAQGSHQETLAILSEMAVRAEQGARTGSSIEIAVLQALTLQALGRSKEARVSIAQALKLAEPSGYLRLFLDEGAAMAHLLKQVSVEEHGEMADQSALFETVPKCV